MLAGKNLFVVTQKNPVEETPGFDGIYNIGTVVVIRFGVPPPTFSLYV